MSLRKIRNIRIACLTIALVFVVIGWLVSQTGNAPVPVLIFLIAGMLIPMVINAVLGFFWRCPCCDRGLGRRGLWISYCPYCGEYLFDE